MEDQVLTIAQMQELIDMGVDISKASMCWIGCADGNGVYPYDKTWKKCFEEHLNTIPKVLTPTFTLQDMLNILPNVIMTEEDNFELCLNIYQCNTQYRDSKHNKQLNFEFGGSILESTFKMLKWCKQNNYI